MIPNNLHNLKWFSVQPMDTQPMKKVNRKKIEKNIQHQIFFKNMYFNNFHSNDKTAFSIIRFVHIFKTSSLPKMLSFFTICFY